jgi:hypothetical protein
MFIVHAWGRERGRGRGHIPPQEKFPRLRGYIATNLLTMAVHMTNSEPHIIGSNLSEGWMRGGGEMELGYWARKWNELPI